MTEFGRHNDIKISVLRDFCILSISFSKNSNLNLDTFLQIEHFNQKSIFLNLFDND